MGCRMDVSFEWRGQLALVHLSHVKNHHINGNRMLLVLLCLRGSYPTCQREITVHRECEFCNAAMGRMP